MNRRLPNSALSVPYQKYTQKQINHQLDLSDADIRLISLIHFFDRGGYRACFAMDVTLADQLNTTEGSIRNRISRLRKKGYVVTIGYEPRGVARRRVVLQYGIKPGVNGAFQDLIIDGRPHRVKRKNNQPNPIIFRLNSESPVLLPTRVDPSHLGERQNRID